MSLYVRMYVCMCVLCVVTYRNGCVGVEDTSCPFHEVAERFIGVFGGEGRRGLELSRGDLVKDTGRSSLLVVQIGP